LQSYITAAENRAKALEYCRTSFTVNTWEEKAPRLSALAAAFSRVCDTMSHELQNLYALEERLRQATDKGLHIVIEHVESPWRPEHAPSADSETEALAQDISPSQSQSAET
jgi:nitrate/nitrite-specific signal transduction histidine kinase